MRQVHEGVPYLTGPAVRPAVQSAFEDRRAPDAAVHYDVEQVLRPPPRAEEVLTEGGGVGIVVYQNLKSVILGHHIPELESSPSREARRAEEHAFRQEDGGRKREPDAQVPPRTARDVVEGLSEAHLQLL